MLSPRRSPDNLQSIFGCGCRFSRKIGFNVVPHDNSTKDQTAAITVNVGVVIHVGGSNTCRR